MRRKRGFGGRGNLRDDNRFLLMPQKRCRAGSTSQKNTPERDQKASNNGKSLPEPWSAGGGTVLHDPGCPCQWWSSGGLGVPGAEALTSVAGAVAGAGFERPAMALMTLIAC